MAQLESAPNTITRLANTLRALHHAPDGLSTAELAARLDLPEDAATGLVDELEREEFVATAGDRLSLGPRTVALARAAQAMHDLGAATSRS